MEQVKKQKMNLYNLRCFVFLLLLFEGQSIFLDIQVMQANVVYIEKDLQRALLVF